MIDNLTEAISHAREVAEEQRKKAERNIIETTKEGWIRVYDGKEYNACLECAREHEQLAAWLTELQKRRAADRWISVNDKLPEEETDVLVCNGKGDMIVCRGSRSTEIKDEFIWYVCDWRYGEITHWKPLPEPYESEA